MKFIPGVSYREFVHEVLVDAAVKTVKQGLIAFRKLINKELNTVRTAGMGDVELERRKKKSAEITREKIKTSPAYRAHHNADCNRWEKEQREKKTPYNTNRKAAKKKIRDDYKLIRKSKFAIKCDIINGNCNRKAHKRHRHQGCECPLKKMFVLIGRNCHPLPYTRFSVTDVVYKLF